MPRGRAGNWRGLNSEHIRDFFQGFLENVSSKTLHIIRGYKDFTNRGSVTEGFLFGNCRKELR